MKFVFDFLSMQTFADGVVDLVKNGIRLIDDALTNTIGTTLLEMVIQLICTFVIFLIVRLLIWNKVTDIIEQRKKVVRDALQERDQALLEAKQAREEAEQVRKNSIAEASRIRENEKKRGYSEAETIIKNANEEAKLKIDNANEEIERMHNESEAAIKKEIVDVAYLMASKIIEKEVEKDKYQDLSVDDFIKENK